MLMKLILLAVESEDVYMYCKLQHPMGYYANRMFGRGRHLNSRCEHDDPYLLLLCATRSSDTCSSNAPGQVQPLSSYNKWLFDASQLMDRQCNVHYCYDVTRVPCECHAP